MKRPADIVQDVERRLARTWAEELTGELVEPAWPHRFSLGSASVREVDPKTVGLIDDWRRWTKERGLELVDRGRRIGVVTHLVPSHVVLTGIDEAARTVGVVWQRRLQRARHRIEQLRSRFPEVAGLSRIVRDVDSFSDVDFELLLRAGEWFARNSAMGLTPRQVPLEGIHAKWLNTRQHLVTALAGVDGLGLMGTHPARIHFTYLDQAYLDAGGRRHDSATVGDRFTPAYLPKVVVISENKDTAIHFPDLPAAISVEGVGRGGGTIASFPWLIGAPTVIYWGDMDPDGLEILDGFLAAGVPARPILMDQGAFERYERYGTDVDKRGAALAGRDARKVPHLAESQLELYRNLVDPAWPRARRIEQERIPLEVAREAVIDAARRA